MKRLTIILILLALGASVFLLQPGRFFRGGDSLSQRRRPRPAGTQPPATTGRVDYAKFSHATKEHQGACKTCHEAPTANWKKVRAFPDVADFPDHDTCVRCHRQQFFKSTRPIICTDCHTKVSPRDDARFSFRNPNRPRQFLIEFPHDRHQDVIAALPARGPFASAQRSSFVKSAHAVDDRKKYNNCELCHLSSTQPAVAPAGGWVDAFAPPNDTFKNSPLSHASCFNCHWSGQEPVKENCAGCHKLAGAPYTALNSPKRISMKFRHDGGGDKGAHIDECATCHINITKAVSLRGLKPDVPIYPSCAKSSCHSNILGEELNKLSKAAPGAFKCIKCHTSDVGGRKPPNSHSLALLGQ